MMGIEWLKPGVFFGSMLYALVGVLVFWICFLVVDKLTPYKLWDEIIEKQNVALAIVVRCGRRSRGAPAYRNRTSGTARSVSSASKKSRAVKPSMPAKMTPGNCWMAWL